MQNYLINSSADYADEFDYPVISILNQNELDFLKAFVPVFVPVDREYEGDYSFWFGTNESLDFCEEDCTYYLDNATAFTEDESTLVHLLFNSVPAVDLVAGLKDRIAENFNDVDRQFYQNIKQTSFENLCKKYPSITEFLEDS